MAGGRLGAPPKKKWIFSKSLKTSPNGGKCIETCPEVQFRTFRGLSGPSWATLEPSVASRPKGVLLVIIPLIRSNNPFNTLMCVTKKSEAGRKL